MPALDTLLLNYFATFTLVLARVGALIATVPIFGNNSIPMVGRALFTIMITLLITPLLASHPVVEFSGLLELAKLMLCEALVGMLFGLGITILLSGIQLTGQIISQLGGTALADTFDPTLNENISVFPHFLYFLTLTMFVLLDGHRLVIDALLDSYSWLPPGKASLGTSYVDALITILGQSFLLGMRAAAPAMTALLLATIVLGLIGRTLPQINILAVGFSINALLTLASLFTSIGVIAWAFPQQTATALEILRQSLHSSIPAN